MPDCAFAEAAEGTLMGLERSGRDKWVAGTQHDLGLPGDIADGLRQVLVTVMELATDAGSHAIGSCPVDLSPPGQSVAGLDDAAAPGRSTARTPRRHEAEIGHQLTGLSKRTRTPISAPPLRRQ